MEESGAGKLAWMNILTGIHSKDQEENVVYSTTVNYKSSKEPEVRSTRSILSFV